MKKIPDLATRIFFAWYAVFIHLESPIVYKCSATVCYCTATVVQYPVLYCTSTVLYYTISTVQYSTAYCSVESF